MQSARNETPLGQVPEFEHPVTGITDWWCLDAARCKCIYCRIWLGQTTLIMLKWAGKLAVMILVVSLWAWPLMACMLPDAFLTVEERECCKSMADDCGQMDMPSSHSCCKVVVRQADPCVVKSRFQTVPSLSGVSLCGASTEHPLGINTTPARAVFAGHSPPVTPPETVSILRI